MSAKITHGHSFGLRALDQPLNRGVIENKFQSMLAAEFLGKLTRTSFEHLCFKFVSFGHQPIKHTLWLAHEGGGNTQLTEARSCQVIFVIAEQFFEYCQQST